MAIYYGMTRIIARNQFGRFLKYSPKMYFPQRQFDSYSYNYNDEDMLYRKKFGNREVVGFGMNGEPQYFDRWDYPFPSLRYMPPLPDILALREKERGDWHLLTIKEKKLLYRASFCQTLVEIEEPTGEWMLIVGASLILASIGVWLFLAVKFLIYSRMVQSELLSIEGMRQQLVRMLDIRVNPILGISSHWDYEKMKWKSKPWYIPFDNPYDEDESVEYDEE